MKGIYIISTLGHGSGGHFHSLNAIADAINDKIEIKIINIGLIPSPVLKESRVKFEFIYCNGFNIFTALKRLKKLIKIFNPDFLHSFDDKAYLFSRIIFLDNKTNQILTKCGGPNEKHYPYCNNLILFSKENFNYYKKHLKFINSDLHYLPNRLSEFADNYNLIAEIKKITENNISFLRISRITEYYEKGLVQSIKLIDKLSLFGFKVVLVIIGVVESKFVLQKLKSYNSNVIIITDKKYTQNAKSVINGFDFVIGTGRGLMEATSKGKLLLSPSDSMEYPILVDDETFNSLFNVNFSPRNIVDISDEENLNKIIKSIRNKDYADNIKKYIKQIYQQNFEVGSVINTYIELYKNAGSKRSFYKIDLIPHFAYVIKEFIAYYLKNIKRDLKR